MAAQQLAEFLASVDAAPPSFVEAIASGLQRGGFDTPASLNKADSAEVIGMFPAATAQAAAEARADSQPKQLQAGLLRRTWPPVAAAHRHMLCKRPFRLHQLCCQCPQKRHAKPLLTTCSTLPRRCSSSVQRQGLQFDAASIVTTAQRELLAEVAAVVGKLCERQGSLAPWFWSPMPEVPAHARPLARDNKLVSLLLTSAPRRAWHSCPIRR